MPKADPAAVIPDVANCCPVCKTPLVRSDSGWVCAAGLDHVRILSDDTIAKRLRLPKKKPPAMTSHQWGWYRTRPDDWANRIVRELRRGRRTPVQTPAQGIATPPHPKRAR